jgi:peptide/nickel transport system substrate-binding protein
VKFHNGEPFDAEAVRFSIQRYLDPKTNFPAGGFLDSIVDVAVVDPYTVDIITKYPDGLLLNRLAGFVLIVPPTFVKAHGPNALDEHPIGTGPFCFDAWDKGKDIKLSANHQYWLPGHPKVEHLTFRFAPADQQVKLLLNGEVDLVTELPGTMTMTVKSNPATRVVKLPSFWTVGATLNTAEGSPLHDKNVRKAMNLAIDRNDLVKFDSMGNGAPIASLTMAGEGGHDPELPPWKYDVAEANRLLDEAKVTRPLVLKTLVRTQSDRTAHIIQSQLARVGIKLDIQGVWSDGEVIQHMASEKFDVAIGGGPDPMCHAFFMESILFFSRSPFSLQKDPQFDGQLIGMVTELNDVEREKKAREIDRHIHDECLSLFTYQKTRTYGLRSTVSFTPYISTMPYFFDASVGAAPASPLAGVEVKP